MYVRLHGFHPEHEWDYTAEELEPYASRIVDAAVHKGKDVFVFFLNDANARAPQDAKALSGLVAKQSGLQTLVIKRSWTSIFQQHSGAQGDKDDSKGITASLETPGASFSLANALSKPISSPKKVSLITNFFPPSASPSKRTRKSTDDDGTS